MAATRILLALAALATLALVFVLPRAFEEADEVTVPPVERPAPTPEPTPRAEPRREERRERERRRERRRERPGAEAPSAPEATPEPAPALREADRRATTMAGARMMAGATTDRGPVRARRRPAGASVQARRAAAVR